MNKREQKEFAHFRTLEHDEIGLKKYKNWSPNPLDAQGLNAGEFGEWLVCPVILTRDAQTLEQSNFEVLSSILEKIDPEFKEHHSASFGHWACGHFDILRVKPLSRCAWEAYRAVCALSDYPVLCGAHHSELEHNEAQKVWESCYDDESRLEYIRDNRNQFEFRDFADLRGCVKGEYFCGYDSELLY